MNQVHGPFDSIEDFLGSVFLVTGYLAIALFLMYRFHKKYLLKGKFYSPANLFMQLWKPYFYEFYVVGSRATVTYEIRYGSLIEAMIFHKKEGKDKNEYLYNLLLPHSRADVRDHADKIGIKILSVLDGPIAATPAPPGPVPAEPQEEPGIVIGE